MWLSIIYRYFCVSQKVKQLELQQAPQQRRPTNREANEGDLDLGNRRQQRQLRCRQVQKGFNWVLLQKAATFDSSAKLTFLLMKRPSSSSKLIWWQTVWTNCTRARPILRSSPMLKFFLTKLTLWSQAEMQLLLPWQKQVILFIHKVINLSEWWLT